MADIKVGPQYVLPTHDISLEDDQGNKIGLMLANSQGDNDPKAISRASTPRTAMKTSTGTTKYSDFEPPWTPVAQDTWVGGRGLDDFDADATRYFDSYRATTQFGSIYLGGQETYASGLRTSIDHLPGNVLFSSLNSSRKYIAVKVIPAADITVTQIALYLKRKGNPESVLTVELCTDNANTPDAVLASGTLPDVDLIGNMWHVTIPATLLTNLTPYWIKVYGAGAEDDADNHWMIGAEDGQNLTFVSPSGTAWSLAQVDLYYRLLADAPIYRPKFFVFRDSTFMLLNTGAAPKLYINGWRGKATSGTVVRITDTAQAWTVDELVGLTAYVRSGAGAGAASYRTIASNDATSFTVSADWPAVTDTSTEYVILGSNRWIEVTGTGLTADVTSIAVINNIVYFCMGDDVLIRRMAGAGAYSWANETSNKASFLVTVRDATNGNEVWRAVNADAPYIQKSPVQDWGTDLAFTTASKVEFKDSLGKITNIVEYGDVRALWIFREATVFEMRNAAPYEIPLREMRALRSKDNGSALLIHNIYLYFNLGSGMERYYDNTLDDVGPNRDEGLPAERQGIVSAMAGYPGLYFVAVDAGTTGYSSVLVNNGSGWHEFYRAPAIGQRILGLTFQPIPGPSLDRLWITVGADVIWLPFPSMTIYPYRDPAFRYSHECALTTGWMYEGLMDVWKTYDSVKIFAEGLEEGVCWIEVDYMTDQDNVWHTIDGAYDQSPVVEQSIGVNGANGKRIRVRLRILTTDNTKSPRMKTLVVESIQRVPIKYSYAMPVRMRDRDVNKLGILDEPIYAEDKLELLEEWATQLTPLIMHSNRRLYDDKKIFIDPLPSRPNMEISEGYIVTLTAVER